ncbi:MAG TPA: ABC transporter ATP-binding protein [Candidatus Saccharimonadales bacterium]|nr:ABC transporter ATP-binding protein [Candidatus Saccharimonadales bacterium]
MNALDTNIAVQTEGLGKRYGTYWALQDCNITVPTESITALVGPNGAGKSTLLKLLANLSSKNAGTSLVLGQNPEQSFEFISQVGYVAQDIPLYTQLTVSDHITMGKRLNHLWDGQMVKQRLGSLGIPMNKQVKDLSGGQHAQVGLVLALAKKPRLLMLDEPVAALDPLARRDFLASLVSAAAENDLTILMSSHILADLERICDRLILLATGRVHLCDDIDSIRGSHLLLTGPRIDEKVIAEQCTIIQAKHSSRQSSLLVRVPKNAKLDLHGLKSHQAGLEEIILAYMRQDITNKNKGTQEDKA